MSQSLEFGAQQGQTFTAVARAIGSYNAGTAADSVTNQAGTDRYLAVFNTNLPAGAYRLDYSRSGVPFGSEIYDVAGDGTFQPRSENALRADQADDIATDVASQVYQRLAGSRVAVLAGPPPAGSPLDTIITAQFDYTIPVVIAADSQIKWFIRHRPKDPSALLVASKQAGLLQLMAITPVTAGWAVITRTATDVRVVISAEAMQNLPTINAWAELREITAAGAQITRHEVQLDLRHSAGRVA